MTASGSTELAVVQSAVAVGSSAFLGVGASAKDPQVAAREFAGLFYTMMLSEMQKTVPENPYLSSRGEEVFRSMWTNELARSFAARPNDPLTSAVLDEIRTNQGGHEGSLKENTDE